MLTHTPSRAKLPFLIAAWMLVAIIALIGSGLTGTTQAQGTSGVIPSINLDSNEAGQLIITWATPEQAPTDYRIRWANTNLGFPSYSAANEPERGNEYPLVDVNTLTLSDLTPGDSYKVQIRSRYYNADRSVRESSGPWTATTTQRVKNHPPAAPTGLTASPVEHNSLTLTWNNPQDTNITGYRIQRGTDANSLHTIEANTGSPSTNYTDITVEPETTYHYAVQALSQDGNGARAITSGTTPAEPDETVQNEPPAVPTGLATSKVSHDSLTLTWDDPEDDSITGYRVMRGDSATSLSTLEDNTQSVRTEYEDATVAPETTYHYAVVALSANGDSPQSSSMSATTPAAPKSKDPPPQRVGARQATTTDVWTATLTPADISTIWKGCRNNCNNAAILSDDDFTYDSIDYTIVQLTVRNNPSPLLLGLTPQITAADADGLTLVVGSTSFPFANATFAVENSARTVTWSASGLSWTVGTDVAVKITVTNNAPTVANAIPNQTATTGTAFSYRFPANTFNDTDTGDTLTYTTTKADGAVLPTWLMFDAGTRTFSGTPTAAETFSVKVTASDGTASVSDEFDITVNATIPEVPANWSLKPSGLAAGDQFRLLFLSSTKRIGTSTDIATYNTFVQGLAAAGHADIQSYSTGFRVVGCTADTDARDNTSTTYTSTDKGVPIYWLNGAKVADQYEDFYDGDWDDEANDKNESGTDAHDTSVFRNSPLTGCDHDGTEASSQGNSRALGASRIRVAQLNSSASGHGPISNSVDNSTPPSSKPMYGLSAVFQVADATNTPAAGAPAITAPNVFRVPAVLGVDLSGITDTDGTTDIATTATYKWQRFAADGTTLDTDSIGTASTYTLTDADAGKTLKVVVSYTDNGGNSEGPLTSAATAAITAAASCAAPTLTGGAVFLGPARKVVVGEFNLGAHAYYGFNEADDAGSIDNASFTTADLNNYEILVAATRSREDWLLVLDAAFPANVQRTLALHFCDEDMGLGSVTPVLSTGNYYYTSDTLLQNWSPHTERTIYLSQDTVAPTFASATVSGTTLVIAFNEPLGAAGSLANSAFTVKKGPSGSQTTLTLSSTAPVISGSTVTLTLATASSVTATDTNVLVTYTKPTTGTANKLLDAFGNETGTFEDQAVTNLLSDTAATAPTAADGTVTTNEDTVHTFAAASFSYSDTDGDALASVKITGLPAAGKGTLALDGTVIASTALPVTVTAAELTENKLKYAPPANANGTGYASFRFRVNDGASDSDLDYTMTINVTAVNDSATGTPTINGTALVGQTLTASIADIADADGLPGTFTYQWKRYAANGTTFEANIGANSSTYTLTASEEGKKVKIEVSFTDNGSTSEGPLSSGAYPASGTVAAVSTDATLSALTVSPKDISGFAADRTSYEVGVASTVTQATITATKSHSAATVAYSTTDADTSAGHQVNLSAGRNEVTITVTAEDATTTGTYTVSINRGVTAVFGWKASDDFDGLITAENNHPVDIWSDGTTIWVSDLRDAKIYAYNLGTKARDASKDFDTLDAASNDHPRGIWSDGTTMWVADYADDKVYAYVMTTKARDASKDFDTPDNTTGIWSDGTTIWVAAHQPGNIYAYDMTTKARDAGKDFDTLAAAGNGHPGGIWSNNITMWVTDEDDDKLYAYNMASKARDAGKDFNTLIAAGNGSPGGIWATTNTMWASDRGDGKIYSYNMPVIAPNTPAAGTPAVTAPNVFRVPAVLGVDLSGITDADGTTGIASNATYKWQRFAANGTTLDTDSIGTVSTYILTDADAGKTLKVVVSYTDNGGNSEGPLTSAATRAITAAATDCNAPTLTGGAVFLGSARKVGVGEFDLGGHAYHGFNKAEDAGSIDNASFTTAAPNDYEILGAATKDSRDWMVALDAAFPANVQRTLAVHFCDEDIAFNAATPRPRDGIYYYTSATPPQHWAPHAERTIYVSQDTVAPTFASATVSGTTLVITLSEDLGAAGSLANSAFTVKKGVSGTAQTLSGTPSISGSTVTLTLATASSVTATDTNVLVTYTKPTTGSANKLRDEFGNETATFPDQDVTNNTATNTPATGVPTISGTAAVGQTLTASTTGISDTDGLPSAFAYQWKRVDSDGTSNPTNIGTNSATYTLTDSEVGKKVLVEVSFTDNATNSEGPLVSAAYPSTGTVRAADTTAPTVMSIERHDPTEPLTNSDTPTWRVTFSEAVKNVDATDFIITGTTATPTVTPVTSVTGAYDVTPTGGDIASLTGTITLAFASGQNIADTADNELAATAPTGINEPTFEMDNTVPTFVSGTANGTLIVMTFSEELDPNSLPPASAFNISTDSNVMANSVSIEGAMVTLTVTPAIIVNQTVDVNNNAYAGTGTVPLKDTAGNEVQPAAIVGSYRVTNETPIGPPASLRAEAGDGRVRLVWTRPAGISQFIDYQFRHAPGTSVPVGTAWIGITSDEGLTELVQELANGMTHAFEVRAIRDSDVGAAATVSATPMADTCMLDLDDRREVWSATMTVGRDIKTELAQTDAGYRRGIFGSLPQDGDSFMIGGASYTIKDIFTIVRNDGVRRQLFLELVNSRRFTPAVKEALRFHWCSNSSGLADPTPRGYLASNPYQADWSLYTTREIALSLPANNSATGTPMITGTAVAAQALTASTTGISDPDGLPSAFAYQWKRVDSDGISNPTNIGADSATYTLTDNEVGKKVLVEVSFTDSLTGAESLASAAHPSTGTVRAADTTAPTVTSITPQDPTSSPTNSDSLTWRVTFSEAVSNVDSADFVITGTTATLTVTAVTSMTGVYDVTASGGDLDSLDGAVTLAFAADQNIVDPSDNTLTATAPTGTNEPTFELDNTIPTFASGTANGTLIVMTFSEDLDPNSLPPGSAFDISTDSNVMVNKVSIEGTMVTLTVTPAIIVDQTVDVNNNAYAGTGTVPLQDTAGNEVQPAVLVGSHRVTNETPIGPPASLTAEAGDGRVRLVWTRPAGISEYIDYQFRHAPGASVPVNTAWIGTTSLEGLTDLVSGLANGTTHAFELRGVRDSEVGATATVSATPMADTCMLDLGDRREVWSATLTVERSPTSESGRASAGYRRGELGSLPQDGDSFMIGRDSYTINDIYTTIRGDGSNRQIFLELVNSHRFTPAAAGALLFHWCSYSSGFDEPSNRGYQPYNTYQADWSIYNTREIALSLPANNDATGTPDITGRALAGQILTAGMGDIADADGLPNASDFAWQWIRVADATETAIQDATSSTYTLTDDDAGKQVKVVMSFTDSLSGVESLISDAYPGTGTVSAAPMPLAVTQREDRPYTFTESDFSNLPGGVVQLTKVIITELPNNGWLARSKIVLLPSGNYQGQSDRIYSRHLPLTLSTDHRRLSLAFFPEDDGNGTPYASLKFTVNDSTTEHTMTINVTPVNDPAYGKVFINGPSQVGYDLTASTSSMGDRDGIPQDQLNYQWKRYSSDGNTFESDIGVNSRTYTLTTAEEGKKVKVEVSYVDGGGTSEATLSEAFPYITDQTIGESTFQSIMGSAGDTFYDFTAEHGQAFTTGTHPNGYTLSRVVLQSEDAEGDDLAVKICGVNTNGNPNMICTDLNVPGSFTRGLLSFTAPSNTTLDGGRTNYMVVISSTGGDSVRLDATRSGGFDPSALGSGWSIATKTRMNTTAGWQDVNGTRIRIAILGTINP